MAMTPGLEDSDPQVEDSDPRSPEGAPTIEDFPSTTKSLEKLFRGVCDPRRTGAYDTDEEEDVSYDLYLQEGVSSPVTDPLVSRDDNNAAVLKATPLPPPPPNLEEASPSPSPYEGRADSPRRVLFPRYNDSKAMTGDSPSSEVTARIENSIKTPPAANTTSSKRKASMNKKPPSTSWVRRFLMFVTINAIVVGVLVHYFKTPAGSKVFDQISSNIFQEERGLFQYASNMEKKLIEAIGEENIAMIDQKTAEILADITEYYHSHFQSTPVVSTPVVSTPVVSTPIVSTPIVSTPAINEDEMADQSENSLEEKEEEIDLMTDISEDCSFDASVEAEESSELDETNTKKTEELDSSSYDADAAIEVVDGDTLDIFNTEADVDEEDADPDEEEVSEIKTNDSAPEETSSAELTIDDDGDDDEEEVMHDSLDEEFESGVGEQVEHPEEDEDLTEKEENDEQLEDPNLIDAEESVRVEEDSGTFGVDESSLGELDLKEESSEEIYEDEATNENPEIVDSELSIEENNFEESTIEQEKVVADGDDEVESGSDKDAEEVFDDEIPVQDEAVEEAEDEMENPNLEVSQDISPPVESSNDTPAVETNMENEDLDEGEDDSAEQIYEDASPDGYTEIKVSVEEESEGVGVNGDEETIIHEDEPNLTETKEDAVLHETKEVEEEDQEFEMQDDELSVSQTPLDEPQEYPESDGDEIELQVNSDEAESVEESPILSQDQNLAEDAILEDGTSEEYGDEATYDALEVVSKPLEANVRDENHAPESIETMPSDIPGMIQKIQEITKRNGPSTPLPSAPSDISDMIKGIEDMLRKANVQRVYHQEEELKVRKMWNTPLGWMSRKQRSS